MKKKNRTFLFFFCLVIFLILTPIIILYSQGYRADFNLGEKKIKFVQTGGMYFKVSPKTADIYLNGKLKKKTSFLGGSTLIKNLIPESYLIEISKEGYKTWRKNLEVKQKTVTEAKNITLFPENFQFQMLLEKIDDFWIFPDGEKIITLESPSEEPGQWELKLLEIERNIKSYVVSKKDIYSKEVSFFDLNFEGENDKIYLNLGLKEQEKRFSLKLDETPPLLKEVEEEEIPEYFLAYEKDNNKIYYIDNSGHLYQTDNSFKPKLKLTKIPFPVKQETSYKIKSFLNYFFLQEEKNLYILNNESKSFEKIFSNLSGLRISPNEDKIALFSNSEIKVFFLREINERPKRKFGDEILITRLSENIENVSWINPNYLIFTTGENIKVSEIDDRDTINTYTLGTFKNPKMVWNERDKKIYVLSENNLYSSDKLISP